MIQKKQENETLFYPAERSAEKAEDILAAFQEAIKEVVLSPKFQIFLLQQMVAEESVRAAGQHPREMAKEIASFSYGEKNAVQQAFERYLQLPPEENEELIESLREKMEFISLLILIFTAMVGMVAYIMPSPDKILFFLILTFLISILFDAWRVEKNKKK